MKLARPDIPHPRIVLAGSQSGDDAGLVAALRTRGQHARWLSWDDPATLDADVVILRTVTDYAGRLDEFLGWTRRVPNLINGPDAVAWNAGRHYLRDLREAGVPTRSRRPAAAVARTALMFLGGVPSHALSTAAESPIEADFELWDLGQAGLQAAADHLGIGVEALLYARVDVIGGPGDAEVVELDLVAPSLGWRQLDDAVRDDGQRQFALCVESALDRLGLGPLSHRGP